MPRAVPSYLRGYSDLYAHNPRAAALQWFRDARHGLFLHYGLYSLEGRHEWLQQREKIPVADYEKLADRFTAAGFDADAICRLALDAGMRYVNLTTRHHECFCLWDTRQTSFNSVTGAPAKRDLVAELAQSCEKHGLGLFLYYSHGRDWKHPHAPNNDTYAGAARPDYDPPEPSYAIGKAHNLNLYLDFMKAQITELLTNYGPIAGIWLDGIAVPLNHRGRGPQPSPPNSPANAPEFRCQELYNHIHALQPQTLVSYKQGLLGTEDFFAPEHKAVETGGKPGEICTTMCDRPVVSWGYLEAGRGQHKTEAEVWAVLERAAGANCNLLLNTGPLPDGSLDDEDTEVLRHVGERLRRDGFPTLSEER